MNSLSRAENDEKVLPAGSYFVADGSGVRNQEGAVADLSGAAQPCFVLIDPSTPPHAMPLLDAVPDLIVIVREPRYLEVLGSHSTVLVTESPCASVPEALAEHEKRRALKASPRFWWIHSLDVEPNDRRRLLDRVVSWLKQRECATHRALVTLFTYSPHIVCNCADVYLLHEEPSLTDDCFNMLHDEWGRSSSARLASLRHCRASLPTYVVLQCGVLDDNSQSGTAPAVTTVGAARVSRALEDSTGAVIESVVIRRELRGRRLGALLMRGTELYLASQGMNSQGNGDTQWSCTTAYLSTHDRQRFYSRLGYVACSPITPLPSGSMASTILATLQQKQQQCHEQPQVPDVCTAEGLSNELAGDGAPPPPPPPPPASSALPAATDVVDWFSKPLV